MGAARPLRVMADTTPSDDPCDDTERLQALQRYGILDTPMEPAYDELADLAGYICEAPVALISLLDNQRHWFKAARGFALRETPLKESVCSYAIRQSGVFIVPDLAQDPRFAHYAIVTQKNPLRFYAGAPLVTPDGFVLGMLCVLDHRPRELSAKVQDLLSALARQVIRLLELKRANDRQGQMLVELEAARHQMDVLAHTDVLTGLAHRRSFTDRLRQEWALLQRGHEPACLLMMDLDHFKRVNDVYGHPVGDQALQLFATLRRDVFRAADVLGRWGGRGVSGPVARYRTRPGAGGGRACACGAGRPPAARYRAGAGAVGQHGAHAVRPAAAAGHHPAPAGLCALHRQTRGAQPHCGRVDALFLIAAGAYCTSATGHFY